MSAHPRRLAALLAAALAACGGGGGGGDDPGPRPPPDTRSIREKLGDVDAIVSIVDGAVRPEHAGAGRRFFVLEFEQPVDHFDPSQGTFRQTVTLFYVGANAPMVLATTGYDVSRSNLRSEPSALLGANQLMVEHRYFATSRPDPVRWEHLTIEQAAHDFHGIVAALKPLFPGVWVGTGASKGGMTSIYHRMFFPDDVDATVAYVAPNSLELKDPRYAAFVDAVFARNGQGPCRAQVRALQQAVIDHRALVEPLMVRRANDFGDEFTLLGATRAEAAARVLEFATVEAPFALWQYAPNPAERCVQLALLSTDPAHFPSDEGFAENLHAFFDLTLGSVVAFFGDPALLFFAPYFYQAATELGGPAYPRTGSGELLPGGIDDDPARYPPLGVEKPYDATRMRDVQAFVTALGERILFVYGANDPWTAGAFEENPARDQARVTVADFAGNHGATLSRLPDAERAAALARLRGWLGLDAPPAAAAALRAPAAPAFDPDALLRGPGSHLLR